MSKCQMSPQEFIQSSFCPMVAVLSTPGVDVVCEKNKLTFLQLMRPFSQLTSEVHYRDPSGGSVSAKNLRICFTDALWSPPQTSVAKGCLSESVSSTIHDRITPVNVGNMLLHIPSSAPWFEAWRNTFFQVQFPSDHEFTKHYLGCFLVVSTADTSPMERLAEIADKLQGLMSETPNKLPKWFAPGNVVLVTYLLLHDNTSGVPFDETFEAMKATYGSSKCFFLAINSKNPDPNESRLPPDPWFQYLSNYQFILDKKSSPSDSPPSGVETAQEAGEKIPLEKSQSSTDIPHPLSPIYETSSDTLQCDSSSHLNAPSNSIAACKVHGACLTTDDIFRIKVFINDYCNRSLIPYIEQNIQHLSDQISNKKGVSRSLLSATKRWFGSSKPGLAGSNIPPTAIAYSSDCHELQLRRLGDLYFMVGNYNMAFQAYHSAKRDFGADGAWLHYAGALEMAALSAFMSKNETLAKKIYEYAEESITTYLTACKLPQFATRATILSVECLKGKNMYGEAANQLIRMSSEDSDLRSAVLLEQAAYCFLQSTRPVMSRKYAFHMVMAGHRYSKAFHKNHSVRCYRQAYQVYKNRQWSVSEDHINYTVAKHCWSLKDPTGAVKAFTELVTKSSSQTPQQQLTFLKEYITTIKQLSETTDETPKLSLPILEMDNFQVLLNKPCIIETSNERVQASGVNFHSNLFASHPSDELWYKMEELLSICARGPLLLCFKPTIDLLTKYTDNTNKAYVVKNECVCIQVGLRNPLNVTFKVRDLHLLWSMIPDTGGLCSSQDESDAMAESIPELVMLPDTTKNVHLSITPRKTGELHLTGLSYVLVDPTNEFEMFGHQPLIAVPRSAKQKPCFDRRLQMVVVDRAPNLMVEFEGLKEEVMCGEIIPIVVTFKSIGEVPVSRILMASTGSFDVWCDNQVVMKRNLESISVIEIPLENSLKKDTELVTHMRIRVLSQEAKDNLELLFYYEGARRDDLTHIKYRVVRHLWPVNINHFVNFSASYVRSNSVIEKEMHLNFRLRVANNCQPNVPFQFHVSPLCTTLYSSNWKYQKVLLSSGNVDDIGSGETLYMMIQGARRPCEDYEDKDKSSQPMLSTRKITKKYEVDSNPLLNFIGPYNKSPEKDLLCVINWMGTVTYSSGKVVTVNGQSNCILSDPELGIEKSFSTNDGENENDEDDVPILQNFIQFRMEYRSVVNHNFDEKRLCLVPIKVTLKNVSGLDLNVIVEGKTLCNSEDDGDIGLTWGGKVYHLLEIKSLSVETVDLMAVVSTPGYYDLKQKLAITASKGNASNVLQVNDKNIVLLVF